MAINNSTYGTELDESYDTEVIKKYSDEIDLIKRTLEEAGARGCSDAIGFKLFASNYVVAATANRYITHIDSEKKLRKRKMFRQT